MWPLMFAIYHLSTLRRELTEKLVSNRAFTKMKPQLKSHQAPSASASCHLCNVGKLPSQENAHIQLCEDALWGASRILDKEPSFQNIQEPKFSVWSGVSMTLIS